MRLANHRLGQVSEPGMPIPVAGTLLWWSSPCCLAAARRLRARRRLNTDHREGTKSTSAIVPINRDLMRVQRRLKDLGHDPGPIDGRLGLQTQGALKAFQTDYGLAPTGKIDAETHAAAPTAAQTSQIAVLLPALSWAISAASCS
jgi:hypothetical protein